MSNGTPPQPGPNDTIVPISLIPQTGMPSLHQSRSRELIYDVLQSSPKFILNPFGPQRLDLSRPNHHW